MGSVTRQLRALACALACLASILASAQAARDPAIGTMARPRPASSDPSAANPVSTAVAAAGDGASQSAARADAKSVLVAYDASFSPISRTERGGAAGGFAVEVFRRAAAAARMQARYVAFPSFAEAMAALEDKKVDIGLAAVDTPSRREFASFVGPYYTAPTVLVTSLDGGWPSLSSLAGKRLAIDQDHYLIPVIKASAPEVILIEFSSVEAVMDAVAKGTAEAGITNLEVAANYINDRYLGRLQISGTLQEQASELSFMVRKDEPDVTAALFAALASIPPLEKTALANTLLRTRIEIGVPWERVLMIVLPIVTLLSGLLIASAAYGRRLAKARALALLERDAARRAARAKAEFLAEMGHEIRAPLAAISAGLRLVQSQQTTAHVHELLTPIRRSTERLVGLLNRLLDLAKLEAGKFDLQLQPIDLKALIGDLIGPFRVLAEEKGVTIDLNIQENLPMFEMDPFRAQQVLNNLISNAVKFSDRGVITIALRGERMQGLLWALSLRITDQGIGMSEDAVAHLFEKYAQFGERASARMGTGLGLAISMEIVKQSGGRIVARSKLGEGSTFEVSLKVKASDLVPHRESRSPGLPIHVLMVDDDPVMQLLCSEFLRGRGCEVQCVDSFGDAIQAMKTRLFDILVTDQTLHAAAGGSGLDLVAAAAGPDVRRPGRIYILSGELPPEHALPPNLDGWILKPRAASDHGWLRQLGDLVGESG